MGISSYTSEHPLMGIDSNGTKGIFTKFNYDINSDGNSDGLCYNPKKDKNAVPYTFTRYVGVKVINGHAFQLEEAPKNPEKFNRGIEWYTINNKKVGTSKQDLCITKLPYTVNSIAFTNHSGYRDTNITVKYSGDITCSNSIDYFHIRYYDNVKVPYNYFINYQNWILTSEIVGFYDGIGNYNDWLFTVLLDFDIYPLKIGDKSFKYFEQYTQTDRDYLTFYTTDTMMSLFKKLYDNPLYAKVKEELKKQYPNEEYFELYNAKPSTRAKELLKSCGTSYIGYNNFTYKNDYKINKLSFSYKESKMSWYIIDNPKEKVIDSFITYINKIAKRTDELTYQEVMTERQTIADFVKKHKTVLSSYKETYSDDSYSSKRTYLENTKLICYKNCEYYDETLYLINNKYRQGYNRYYKELNFGIEEAEWNKHRLDEFYVNDKINDFVYGLSSGSNYDNHDADTYYFDMAWITHGIPLK